MVPNLVVVALLLAAGSPPLPVAEEPGKGQLLYQRRCALCHGARGDGNGVVARWLEPRPRDFSSGNFKLRSTPTGEPPAAVDVAEAIRVGLPGSSMPAWPGLTPW